jgi:hypothetical protein
MQIVIIMRAGKESSHDLTLWFSRTLFMRGRSNVPFRRSCWASCAWQCCELVVLCYPQVSYLFAAVLHSTDALA